MITSRAIRRFVFPVLIAVSAIGTSLALLPASSGRAAGDSESLFVDKIPHGYRDWKFISLAREEEGHLDDIRAILGNDLAVATFRQRKLPFPEGAIIARLAWSYGPSELNNKAFGRAQLFVPGAPKNMTDARRHCSPIPPLR